MASQPDDYTRAYRIVSSKYPAFDGTGTHRWGSRWVSPGSYVVHAAETYALAVLENLVHWQTNKLPPILLRVVVDIPDHVEQEELDRDEMPRTKANNYTPFRAIGDDWYERGDSVVLWVPSIVSPHESNLLFNQTHPDIDAIVVHKPVPAKIDPRLRRKKKR